MRNTEGAEGRFRQALEEAIRSTGLSQKELAARAKVSRQTVFRVANGDMVPTIRVAHALAEALGTTVGKLLGETSPAPTLPKDLRWDIEAEAEKAGAPFEETMTTLLREAVKARQLGLHLPYISGELPAEMLEEVQIHGVVAASPGRAPELVEGRFTTELPREEAELARSNRWSLLEVEGDSMEPLYRSKDYVWMQPKPRDYAPRKGEDIVFWWDDGLQIKRYDPDPDGVHIYDRFVPLNSAHPTLVRGKATLFRLYGVVVRLAKRKA